MKPKLDICKNCRNCTLNEAIERLSQYPSMKFGVFCNLAVNKITRNYGMVLGTIDASKQLTFEEQAEVPLDCPYYLEYTLLQEH